MRRLQVASAAWAAGEAAYLVGVFVYAYDVGGPAGVATIAVLRTVPSVVLAPLLTGIAGDRPLDWLLRLTLTVRVVTVLGGAALLSAEAATAPIYLLLAIDAVAATLLRPIRGSLLPVIARSPDELVAGNVALTTGDSLANLVGPSFAAATLLMTGPVGPFVPGIGLLLLALISGARVEAAQPLAVRRAAKDRDVQIPLHAQSLAPAFAVMGAFTAQRLIRGALTVLIVVSAIDLLGMGDPGVGLLTAALGLGGLAGGVAATALVGQRRLGPWFVVGIAVWSAALAATGAVPIAAAALLAFTIGGVGKVLIDVAGYSLLQRGLPNESRTRYLGIQEGLVTAALAMGAVGASALIDFVGVQTALIVAGAVPIAAAVLVMPWLRQADAHALGHEAELTLLDGVPLFAPLQLAVKEELAAELEHEVASPGSTIVTQGEPGDRFYIIEGGEATVDIDHQQTRTLGPGDGFGEIALLRDVPRTATVKAATAVRLLALDREHFLAAVTGHRESALAAERLVEERLGG